MGNSQKAEAVTTEETGFASSPTLSADYSSRPTSFRPAPREYEIRDWEVDFLTTKEVLRGRFFGIEAKAKKVRYPIRMLRYWFSYHLLAAEYRRFGRPLDIVEIGPHNGQMHVFAKVAASRVRDPAQGLRWATWLAIDAVPKRAMLRITGYEQVLKGNIDDPDFALRQSFDTAICLHIFEHTSDPGAALRRVAEGLRPGGSIIGGSPVLPHFLVARRERQLRKTAKGLGHVSVFSPTRVRELVADAGLELEFISGAFFMRHKGFVCENYQAWLKFNLWWGQLFPWWPGEIHWLARKPE